MWPWAIQRPHRETRRIVNYIGTTFQPSHRCHARPGPGPRQPTDGRLRQSPRRFPGPTGRRSLLGRPHGRYTLGPRGRGDHHPESGIDLLVLNLKDNLNPDDAPDAGEQRAAQISHHNSPEEDQHETDQHLRRPLELDPKVNIFTSTDHQLTERTLLEVLREAAAKGVLAKVDTDASTTIVNATQAKKTLQQLDPEAIQRANQRAQQCVRDAAGNVVNQGSLNTAFLNLALGVEQALDVRDDQNSPVVAVVPDIAATCHPLIQRGVIPAIVSTFPEVQLVASSCSPMVLAGLDQGQIHVIQGEENQSPQVVSNQQSTRGWTADEVLQVYLGVDHPTDAATADAIKNSTHSWTRSQPRIRRPEPARPLHR